MRALDDTAKDYATVKIVRRRARRYYGHERWIPYDDKMHNPSKR
jgi:hypothetical protein